MPTAGHQRLRQASKHDPPLTRAECREMDRVKSTSGWHGNGAAMRRRYKLNLLTARRAPCKKNVYSFFLIYILEKQFQKKKKKGKTCSESYLKKIIAQRTQ